MKLVLHAVLTELVQLKAVLDDFLVLVGVVIHSLAGCALQFDHVILRHI